jgi:hypothetical protein
MTVRDIAASPRTSYAAGLFLLLAIVGFWPAYFSKLPAGDELYVDLHAAGVVAWIALLIAQPALIYARRRPLHRRLGAVAYGLVPFILLTSLLLAHSRLDTVAAPTFRADATDSYLAQIAIVLFAICAGLGLYHRRNAPLHARFMTATLLPLIDPICFRLLFFYTPMKDHAAQIPYFGYGLTDLVILALAVADRKHPAGSRAFPLLLAIFVPAHLGYFSFARSDAWIDAMAWFKGLPLS